MQKKKSFLKQIFQLAIGAMINLTIFRARENLKYCKERGIHLECPKLGKPFKIQQKPDNTRNYNGWNSGERREIARHFGTEKRWYSLDCIVIKSKEKSEARIHSIVIYMNPWKKHRLLLRSLFSWLRMMIQIR